MTALTRSTRRLDADEPEHWHLRLYVAGQSPKSLKAFANLIALCEEHLDSRYDDRDRRPGRRIRSSRPGDEIVAIPTLVRRLPAPMRKIIGDLSDTDRVLVGLQLRPEAYDRPENDSTLEQFERAARRARTGAVRAHAVRQRRL